MLVQGTTIPTSGSDPGQYFSVPDSFLLFLCPVAGLYDSGGASHPTKLTADERCPVP